MWVLKPERFRFQASPATPWLCHFDSEPQPLHLCLKFKKLSQSKNEEGGIMAAGMAGAVETANNYSLNTLLSY